MKDEISEIYDEIEKAEDRVSEWSEKEFEKLYEIVNDNPLGR